MLGNDLFAQLKRELGADTDYEMARHIGVSRARVTQLRGSEEISPKAVARLVKQVATRRTQSTLSDAIRPIVEFFPIESCQARENGREIPFDITSVAGKNLRSMLTGAHGIYAFYNSQAEIIYFGKAEKQNLYKEMIAAFNRELPSFQMYRVRHPWGKYKSSTSADLRKIKKERVFLREASEYFSAYSVENTLISLLEALFIRIAPNDIINSRMEVGKLKAFKLPSI